MSEMSEASVMSPIMYYDPFIDENITLTQEKFDDIMKFIYSVMGENRNIEDDRKVSQNNLSFKLAVYQNPMRDDGVFVAEDRPIEPYKDIRGSDGGLCYPSIPQHGISIGSQLPHAFAFELVRRWNAYGEAETAAARIIKALK
jgi:hypothetical protein